MNATRQPLSVAGSAETGEASIEAAAAPRERRAPEALPPLSVIVPVRNDPDNLELCLEALEASEYRDFEIIVVDDASTDTTPEVARRPEVRLLRHERRNGPAAARNLGARQARHAHLFFLDADVTVRPDTLGRVAERFVSTPEVDAFFGSYDSKPGAPGVVSQYRNLLHHYVHQSGNEDAFTFWSGCGAVKKSVFLDLGGFDTGYSNASIEDIELGERMRRAGHRIALVKEIQVRHMKRWTFGQTIRCDIQKRGIPWTLLILREGRMPNDLNLRHEQRLSVALAGGLVTALAVAAWQHDESRPWLVLALGCVVGVVGLNWGFYRYVARVKSPLFALLVPPLHLVYYLCSGVAFACGLLLHLVGRLRRALPGTS